MEYTLNTLGKIRLVCEQIKTQMELDSSNEVIIGHFKPITTSSNLNEEEKLDEFEKILQILEENEGIISVLETKSNGGCGMTYRIKAQDGFESFIKDRLLLYKPSPSRLPSFTGKTIIFGEEEYSPREPIIKLIKVLWERRFRASRDKKLKGINTGSSILDDCGYTSHQHFTQSRESFDRIMRRKKIPLRIHEKDKLIYLEELPD